MTFREKVAGEPQLGFCIMYPAPGIIERVGPDWDWDWIDGQHGELDYADGLAIVRACNLIQRPAFLRVPGHDYGTIGKALDCAPAGIIVPGVDTPAQAEAVVRAAKFPPLGNRSYGGRRPIDLYSRAYSDTANADIMLVCQIESPEAIDNVDAIAATPGVDALFLGPDDISLRRGRSMTAPRNKEMLAGDMEKVSAACRKHGRVAVMVGGSEEMLAFCLKMGFQMIVASGDVSILANGSRAQSEAARKLAAGARPAPSRPESTSGSPY